MGSRKIIISAVFLLVEICRIESQAFCTEAITTTALSSPSFGSQFVIPAIIKPVLQPETITAPTVPNFVPYPAPPIIIEENSSSGNNLLLPLILILALSGGIGGNNGGCGNGYYFGANGGGCGCGYNGCGGCGGGCYGGYNGYGGCGVCGNNGCGCNYPYSGYDSSCGCNDINLIIRTDQCQCSSCQSSTQ